ncbi:MAG: hypothetical protein ABSF95_14670 [Verrucomicrobiota bacterium]|jgi:hypothetical protein
MKLTRTHIDKFKAWQAAAWQDAAWAEATRQRKERREQVSREILDLLNAFTAGKLTLVEFKTIFDKKTRKEWDVFGLKGMSGAMFLNMMTIHIPPAAGVADQLKATLAMPKTEADGREKMSGFYNYLNNTLSVHHIPLRKLQPLRSPFFISAWWYLQNREVWPAYYESVRIVFDREGLLAGSNDPVADYFTFRSTWLEVQKALGITPWDLDLLCKRLSKSATAVVKAQPHAPGASSISDTDEPQTDSTHTEVQGLLAELGQKLGCKVWIAANDHNKQWKGQKLKNLSIPSLPNLGMGDDAQKIINLIDLIWLRGGRQVVAAFEVESTTSVFSGLLRMSDLVTTCPNLNILCFIVAPKSRESLVVKQLSRPTFQSLDLNTRCGFLTIESLKQEAPGMMKWVKDPSAIKDLATFVADATE